MHPQTELSAAAVAELLAAVQLQRWEGPNVKRTKTGFHCGRIKEAKPILDAWLRRLPGDLRTVSSATTIPDMCVDVDGNTWGRPRDVDALLLMAIEAGIVTNRVAISLSETCHRENLHYTAQLETA